MSTPRKSSAILHQPAAQFYDRFFAGIKQRIRTAQIKAALAANAELILHYWEIGRNILASQKREGWGAEVIDRLASDLQREFPKLSGYSARNLKYMRAFAEAWPDRAIVQQLVAQLPWGHHTVLLDGVKDADTGVAGEPRDAGLLGRETKGEVVLVPRLRAALEKLNPALPPEAIAAAIDELTRDRLAMSLEVDMLT